MSMEFWGVEVKAGEPLKVTSEEGMILHLSQAALGEVKKDKNESVLVSVTVDGKKMVLGTLSASSCPQIAYDLVFEKDFELSHNWKNGSVYFVGYRAEVQDEESEDDHAFDSDSEGSEEELPVAAADNGKAEPKTENAKVTAEKAKAEKPENAAAKKGKDAKPDEDSDDSEDSEDSEGEDSDDEMQDQALAGDDSDDSGEDDSSEEEEDTPTPKNVKQGKKRNAEAATKTPVPEKKAKLVTPQKSGGDGKKGANTHTATPHPKKGAKTAEKSGSKPQTPKSAANVTCKSCSKTFNSDVALQSHTKAKHSDTK